MAVSPALHYTSNSAYSLRCSMFVFLVGIRKSGRRAVAIFLRKVGSGRSVQGHSWAEGRASQARTSGWRSHGRSAWLRNIQTNSGADRRGVSFSAMPRSHNFWFRLTIARFADSVQAQSHQGMSFAAQLGLDIPSGFSVASLFWAHDRGPWPP